MSLDIIHPASDAIAPFGEVTLAPADLTGRSRSQLAQDMAEHLRAAEPTTGAEALRLLRKAFPYRR